MLGRDTNKQHRLEQQDIYLFKLTDIGTQRHTGASAHITTHRRTDTDMSQTPQMQPTQHNTNNDTGDNTLSSQPHGDTSMLQRRRRTNRHGDTEIRRYGDTEIRRYGDRLEDRRRHGTRNTEHGSCSFVRSVRPPTNERTNERRQKERSSVGVELS